METILGVGLRWVHVSSAVILIGGLFYARYAAGSVADSYRKWILGTALALVGSGLYNLLAKTSLPQGYHMWFGVKMLLALHVLAVGVVMALPSGDGARRFRLARGVVYSGLAILLVSAWLRWLGAR